VTWPSSIAVQAAQHLPGGALASLDRAVHRAGETLKMGGFAGKKQRVLDRPGQLGLMIDLPHRHDAVAPS